jgi:3-hydroxybutyryl-CoA dehydrogenase
MDVDRVAVIGCGTMGHGIAQVSAQAGLNVLVIEQSTEALARALERIEKALDRLQSRGKLDSAAVVRDRITGSTDVATLSDRQLVIEAVDEHLETKLDVWRSVDPVLGPNTVCATNTSSFSVIGQAMVTGRAEQFIGLHFFNPVAVMNLLEVIRSIASSDTAVATGQDFGRRIGKDIVLAPDRAGFIVNRLLLPYCVDAINAFESGFGSIEDIDTAMRGGCGYPMGPFTLLDFVGLDTVFTMTEVMWTEYADARFAAPPTLRKLVEAGFLGRKSGRGFYDYASDPPRAAVHR